MKHLERSVFLFWWSLKVIVIIDVRNYCCKTCDLMFQIQIYVVKKTARNMVMNRFSKIKLNKML